MTLPIYHFKDWAPDTDGTRPGDLPPPNGDGLLPYDIPDALAGRERLLGGRGREALSPVAHRDGNPPGSGHPQGHSDPALDRPPDPPGARVVEGEITTHLTR